MKPKVMLIIPEMSPGGAQRSLAKLSVKLSQHATIFFVVFNRMQPIAYTIAGEVLSLEVHPKKNWPSKTWSFYKRVQRLRALKRKLSIDVSISFLEGADYINILSKSSEKVILSIRGSKLHDEIMQSYLFWLRSRILIPWLYKRADLIVTVNNGIMYELLDFFRIQKTRVKTIYNFYDDEEIVAMAAEPKEEYLQKLYQFPVLITTGRLAPEKRLSYLLRVYIELKKIKNDIRFVFVGDGPELNALLKICENGDLRLGQGSYVGEPPDVIFLGNQRNVFKYLNGASLYLLNSSSEGFPNGMVEAMICNVPVMSADCPYGPREILAPELKIHPLDKAYLNKRGILMPLDNSEKNVGVWAKTIATVLGDSKLKSQLAEGGREKIREFSNDYIISQWLAVITDAS